MPTHVEGWESKANGEMHPRLTAAWDQTDLGTSLAICQTLLEGGLDQVEWEAIHTEAGLSPMARQLIFSPGSRAEQDSQPQPDYHGSAGCCGCEFFTKLDESTWPNARNQKPPRPAPVTDQGPSGARVHDVKKGPHP